MAIKLDPTSQVAYIALIEFLYKTKQYNEAWKQAQRAILDNVEIPGPLVNKIKESKI